MVRRLLLLALSVGLSGCLPSGDGKRSFEASPVRVLTRTETHQSLQVGDKFLPIEGQPGELIWLTGLKTHCVDESGKTLSHRFLGYSTLDFKWPEWHNEKLSTTQSARLFGVGRGQDEYHLPQGFGIPIHSNEPLWFTSRITNPDPYLPTQRLHQELELDYTRQRGLAEPMHPVLVRTTEVRDNAGNHLFELPPGEKTVRTDITPALALSEQTRLIGAAVWMMDYAQSATLRDTKTGEVLWTLKAVTRPSGEVESIESYSDSQGKTVHPDHRYELEVVFHNTGDRPVFVAAYAVLYLEDLRFERPPR